MEIEKIHRYYENVIDDYLEANHIDTDELYALQERHADKIDTAQPYC